MSARILCLVVFCGLVCASVTRAEIDPNLVGWWNFEEGEGALAIDSSDHGHHGTLMGDPHWAPGYDGLALDLDGQSDYVETGKLPSELGVGCDAPRTVALWVYTRSFNGGGLYEMGGDGDEEGFSLRTRTGDNQWRVTYWTDTSDFTTDSLDEWVHFTYVRDGYYGLLYINDERIVNQWERLEASGDGILNIGVCENVHFDGLIDDVRLYSRAVGPDEITQIMAGNPARARALQPGHGSTPALHEMGALHWSAGDDAVAHDVYFGTDPDAVRDATTQTEGIYRGRQSLEATAYVLPETALDWNTTYYWRIDEISSDGAVAKGGLWRFRILDYLIIDDFESYGDEENFIWDTWIDGWTNDTGSTVGYVETICWGGVLPLMGYSGQQPMPFAYDNTVSPWYSEAFRIWEEPQDWTRFGVDMLTLYLTGPYDVSNDPDPVYVALADEAGNLVVVNHPGPLVVGAALWERWDIPLDEFASAGVDVANIKQMFIGVGDRENPTQAGEGMLHFDDIRLTRSDVIAKENQKAK